MSNCRGLIYQTRIVGRDKSRPYKIQLSLRAHEVVSRSLERSEGVAISFFFRYLNFNLKIYISKLIIYQ